MAFGIGDILGAVAGPVVGSLLSGDQQTYQPYGGQPLYQPQYQPQVDQSLYGGMQSYASAIGAPGQPFHGGSGYKTTATPLTYSQWAAQQGGGNVPPTVMADLGLPGGIGNAYARNLVGAGQFAGNAPTQAGYQQYLASQGGAGGGGGGGVSGGGYYGSMLPYAQQLFQQQYNNPYAQSYQTAANLAGLESGNLAGQYLGGAGNLIGAGNKLLQTGFDPQQELYNRLQQQQNEQTNAMLAQRGIATTPYGAGIATQANQNFNIDWQNQQLNRQLQAAKGAEGAYTGGTVLGGAGVNAQLGAGQLPFQAQQGITGAQNQAMQNYYGNIAPWFQAQGNLMNQQANYLGLGQGATGQALSAAQQANQLGAQNAAGISSGITNALAAVPSGAWSSLFQPTTNQGVSYDPNMYGQGGFYG